MYVLKSAIHHNGLIMDIKKKIQKHFKTLQDIGACVKIDAICEFHYISAQNLVKIKTWPYIVP